MLENAYQYIKAELKDFVPDTAIILGSGLGGLISVIKNPITIAYTDIPQFPATTVSGHQGCFYAGVIGRHKVLCMQGRFHLYEKIAPSLIDDIITLLKKLGVKQIIITNAAGSLTTALPAGSLMLINDHINFSGLNPLLGAHEEPYFPDMSNAYDNELRQQFLQTAETENINVQEGVYIMVLGPNYETKSEVRMLRSFGADAVGMSTVPEVISSVHKGLKVLAVSVISNLGTGLSAKEQNHGDVLQQVQQSSLKLGVLIQKFLERY